MQSALNPAGLEAERIATLWWWMAGGTLVIWALVVALAVYAKRAGDDRYSEREARWLILGGGVILPTVVLTGLLIYGLWLLPALRGTEPPPGLRIEVVGERWWWRVRYLPEDGEPVVSANEIRLPVGEKVEFILSSPDVIHSFWIPSLGGKMDMIPGRVTRLVLEPRRVGRFRGACAEFCGASHAYMNFAAVVMEPAAFEAWLAGQAQPAAEPAEPLTRRGQTLFLANGCGACHTVRGTPADGVLGPDLTHVGGRLTLAAGLLPNDPAAFVRWIGHSDELKPEANMPAFGMLPAAELRAMAAYLESLR